MKRICIYCGASQGKNKIFAKSARDAGTAIAKAGLGLVYGGGNLGLMGIVADAALAAGGEVIGVIPKSLVEREQAHRGLTKLIEVETLHQRKAEMEALSDAFLALPGGMGTLDELFEILTWSQLGIHKKPVGILNVHSYFDHLWSFLQHASQEEFLRGTPEQFLQLGTQAEQIVTQLKTMIDTASLEGFRQ